MTQLNNQYPDRYWWILLFLIPFDIALIYIGLMMIGNRYIVFDESNGYIYSYKTTFCGCYYDIKSIGCIREFKGIMLRGPSKIDNKSTDQHHINNCYNHYVLVFRFDESDEIIIGYKNSSYLTAMRLALTIDDYWQQCLSRNKKKQYLIKDVINKSPQITSDKYKQEDHCNVEIEMIETTTPHRFIVTEDEHEEMLQLMRGCSISVGLET